MGNRINELLHDPQALEAFYRSEPAVFARLLDEALVQHPASETLRVWSARLAYEAQPVAARPATTVAFVIALALIAGLLTKLPNIVGFSESWYYPRFVPIIVAGALAAYFQWHTTDRLQLRRFAIAMIVCCAFMLLLPNRPNSASVLMSQVHMPLVLASLLGLVFMGDRWRTADARVQYIRYLGEMLIYSTLILAGGVVLTLVTLALFDLIGSRIENWYFEYVVVFGLVASPIVATYLYDAVLGSNSKLASLLANVFAPLFLVTVVLYLFAIVIQGASPYADRDFLIVFNGLLVVIWGICVFSIAGRRREGGSSIVDYINIALLAVTLVVNAIALSAILFRWAEGGTTPNRVVVTGANILIFGHLLLILREYKKTLGHGADGNGLKRTVAGYLPLYSFWSLFVVVVLPLLFRLE